jgi:soluble lytic murein transglycosylase-like protein
VVKFSSLLTLLVVVVGVAAPAEAQRLYSWRDANGHQVISDRPRTGNVETYPVKGSSSLLATRPPAASYPNQWDDEIARHAAQQNVRPDLVRAVIQAESGFNPRARSPKGAMGLMQLMPQTAAEMGVSNPYDPVASIRGGVAYLRQLLDRYENNEELALAAYNAGPSAVEKYGNTVPPYRETRDYVSRVRSTTPIETASSRSHRVIYKFVEMIDGREVPRYSDYPPSRGPYEVVSVRRRP